MLNKKSAEKFLNLMDEAQDAAREHHSRMRHELAIYNNRNAYVNESTERIVKATAPITHESQNPEIQKGILRLVPGFTEQATRIELLPDSSRHSVEDAENVEDLKQWTQMFQEVDREGERLEDAVYHNLIFGHAISKAVYDPRYRVVRMIPISPLAFSVDPDATSTDLSNAGFLVHETTQNERYVRHHYPEYKIPKNSGQWSVVSDQEGQKQFRIRELWMRRWIAEMHGIPVKDTGDTEIFYAAAIDNDVVRVRTTPYYYPDFPFATWRNFPVIKHGVKQSRSFWGHGYGALCWSQQKFLDEIYSNLVMLLRRLSIGRMISKRGALDMEQVFTGYGVNIEVEEEYDLDKDIKPFPTEAVPPILYDLLQHSIQGIADMMPSLNPVFAGQSPSTNASGRLANTLQWAAFNQISNNVREMNEFRLHRMRLLISLTQQFARRPLGAHIWRRGIDFPDSFREEARYIGYRMKMPDATSLPNTPAGKLEIAQIMAALGAQMSISELIKFVGFDTGYGWDDDTFVGPVQPTGSGGNPLNQNVTSGMDAGMI